jgi:hypothetical protein
MSITPEEDVTVEWLQTLFKEPYFTARIDQDGDLYITNGLDFPIWVTVERDPKMLRYFTYVRPGEQPLTEAASNFLNATVLIPSFHIRNDQKDRFHAKYVLPYDGGVMDAHVVSAARAFAGSCVYAAQSLGSYVLN